MTYCPIRAENYPFESCRTLPQFLNSCGWGIGLSICHGIMEDHNGSIAAKNSSDGGAIFTITLPRVELAIEEK